ncbi:DUF3883 domain-containing protein [Pedobacter sp. P351]|uniref:DUF3883 domain-containing protein n=1 Tax=Pedobacter superstes TaxID=3133441 RepID=UPI003095EF72
MSDLNNFIKNELKNRLIDYTNSPNYILEHHGAERQNIEAYNGRQLLEMLQNADDASASAIEKKAEMVLERGVLRISNNGAPFDEGGFTSLMYIHRSFKPMQKDMIGQKGLGFRSILSWAKSIVIQSAGLQVGFSQQRAETFLKDLIKRRSDIGDFLKHQSSEKFPIAVLRLPEILTQQQPFYPFDTNVLITLKGEETASDVSLQMSNMISMETMLFLKNLDKLELKSPKQHIVYSREPEGDGIRVTKHDRLTNEITSKAWHINRITGKHKKKHYELAIAWNDQLDDKCDLLYSYFETKVRLPFPAILHGTFELTPERNGITDDTAGHNLFLIGKLADLLVDTALRVTRKNQGVSYDALQLLNINFSAMDPRLTEFKFKEALFERMKSKAIFPNVNGKYITHDKQPVFYESSIPHVLKGDDVNDLLIFCNDKKVIGLLDELEVYKYPFSQICNIVSQRLQSLATGEAAQLLQFLFSFASYSAEFKKPDFNRYKLPPLLTDGSQVLIPWINQIFLPHDQQRSFELPAAIKVSFIDAELYGHLATLYGSEHSSLLSSHLRLLGVRAYSFTEIAITIIVHYERSETTEKVLECHRYLFQLFQTEYNKGVPAPLQTNRQVNALSQKNKVMPVEKLYFGKVHGHELAEQLYSYDKNKLLAPYRELGFAAEDQPMAFTYFSWLGVEDQPRAYVKRIAEGSPHYAGYKEYLLRNYNYKHAWDNYHEKFNNYEHLMQDLTSVDEISVTEYDEIDTILQRARPEYIFKWINTSPNLKRTLENNEEIHSSSVVALTIRPKYYKRQFSATKMRSYTRWVMANTPWLPVDSTLGKGSPDRCCLSRTITREFSPYVEKPKLDLAKMAEKLKLPEETLESYLVLIGVHREISSFSMVTLYDMLGSLEKTDTQKTIGSTIYREIASNYNDAKLDVRHPAYQKFLEEGKVLCTKGNATGYFPISESYYINTKNFGNNVLKRFPLIVVDKKRGSQKIRRIFGVQPLQNISFDIIGQPELHSLNPLFEEEIARFKALVYALRIGTDKDGDIKSRVKRTKIHLVEHISAEYSHAGNREAFLLEPFEFVNKKSNYYLLVPPGVDDPDELRRSIAMGDAIAEIFTAVINTEEHRSFIRELFSTREANREELLLRENQLENNYIITAAKLELNIVDDIRLSFWRAFSLASTKHVKTEIRDEPRLRQFLVTKLKAEGSLLETFINIDTYSSLSELDVQELFYDMFLKFKLDFAVFSRHFTGLDFSLLFRNGYEDLKTRYKQLFMESLYKQLLATGELELKRKYFILLRKYDADAYDPADRYQADLIQYFKVRVSKRFKLELADQGSLFSCNDLIHAKVQELAAGGIHIPELLLENEEFQAMLLFNEIDEINTLIQKFQQKDEKTGDRPPGEKQIRVSGSLVTFTDYRSLAEQLAQTTDFSKFKIRTGQTLKMDLPDKGVKRGSNSSGKRAVRFGSGNEEVIGFIAEFLAFNQLVRRYSEKTVEWVSENAFRAVNAYTSEAGKGYDIEIRENDKVRYVEVKGVSNVRDGFRMTGTEMAKALEYPDKYDLLIVENPLGELPIFRYIRSPFKFKKEESLLANKHMNVLNDSFMIKFKWDE